MARAGRRAGLGEPEVDRGATDEDDLVQDRAEQLGGDLELLRAQRFLTPSLSRSRRTRRSSTTCRKARGEKIFDIKSSPSTSRQDQARGLPGRRPPADR